MATTGNFRYKLTTGENKISKPHGYARETPIYIDPQAKKQAGTSSEFNLKGINSCYHCKSTNIIEDFDRAEIYCHDCGIVLRQGLKDYTPLELSNFQMTSKEHKTKSIKKDVCLDL